MPSPITEIENTPVSSMFLRVCAPSWIATATIRGSNDTWVTQFAVIPFGSPSDDFDPTIVRP